MNTSLTPEQHIAEGESQLALSEWAGNTPRVIAERLATASAHFNAATAKLLLAAAATKEVTIAFNQLTEAEAGEETDAGVPQ